MVMERLRKYGPTAVGTYLCLSACTWTCFFIALENHMDVNGLLKRIGGEGWDKKEVRSACVTPLVSNAWLQISATQWLCIRCKGTMERTRATKALDCLTVT